jgi:hypothetical protein
MRQDRSKAGCLGHLKPWTLLLCAISFTVRIFQTNVPLQHLKHIEITLPTAD